jgi:hypothetical protein
MDHCSTGKGQFEDYGSLEEVTQEEVTQEEVTQKGGIMPTIIEIVLTVSQKAHDEAEVYADQIIAVMQQHDRMYTPPFTVATERGEMRIRLVRRRTEVGDTLDLYVAIVYPVANNVIPLNRLEMRGAANPIMFRWDLVTDEGIRRDLLKGIMGNVEMAGKDGKFKVIPGGKDGGKDDSN